MGWIAVLWIVVLPIIGVGIWIAYRSFTVEKSVRGYIAVACSVLILVGGVGATALLTETESFKRFKKTLDSEFKGGITREIIVYSEGGTEIYREKGKFDVEYSNERLKWVDEEGRVQIIYLGRSSTAVVNELDIEQSQQ